MYSPYLKRYRLCITTLALILSFSASLLVSQSLAGTVSPNITVKAVVTPRLRLKVIYQQPEITLTKPDIERGYIVLPSASLLEVESNNPSGYLLAFEGSLGPFKEVHIQGLDRPVQLDSGNAFIRQPYTRNGKMVVELSYRGILPENANPGTYSWPFSISAQPIEYLDFQRKKK